MSLGVTMAAARGRPSRALWWMETVHAAQQVEPDGPIEGPGRRPGRRPGAGRRPGVAAGRDGPPGPGADQPEGDDRLAPTPGGPGGSGPQDQPACGWHPGAERYAARAAALREALGPRLLVEYAPVGRHLVAVVLDGGRCRLFELAPLAEVREAVAGLRLALRTALDADPPTEDQPALREAAADVQRLVLGPLALPPGREVVIVPDGPVLRRRGRCCPTWPRLRWWWRRRCGASGAPRLRPRPVRREPGSSPWPARTCATPRRRPRRWPSFGTGRQRC